MCLKHFIAIICSLTLSACSNSIIYSELPADEFNQRTQPPTFKNIHLADERFQPHRVSDNELFHLTLEQKQEFDDFYYDERYAHLAEAERFSEFLTTRLIGFTYHGDTYTATEAFELMSGNCLSLAILTTALANYAGLEIRYQRVDAPPVYEKHGNILLLSTHVRTRVFGPRPLQIEGLIRTRPYVTIDYFPVAGDVRGEFVSHDSFMAMYHRNMAAKALIEEHYDLAYAHVKRGLVYQDLHTETYNMLAVIYNRAGYSEAALALYSDLLVQDISSLNTLENYASLLQKSGQDELASHYLAQIERVNDQNPYQWLSLAQKHLNNNQLRLALKYADRAKELAPYLHEPHFLMAKVFYQQRKYGASKKSLIIALELAKYSEDESLYQAKLYALKAK